MTERREPTISAYSPSKEELARKQSRGGTSSNPQRASAAQSAAARAVVTAPPSKSPLAAFAFILALIAGGAAGFLYWQMMKAQATLAAADTRIVALESKFELSDDEVSASTETMLAKLKWADSEIRKLWGVSYDTNRKAIDVNKNGIAKVAKTASSMDAKLQSLNQSLSAELKLLSDLVDAQQASLIAIEQQNQEVLRGSQSLSDRMNSLDSNAKAMERRVTTNEQAIEAIDAFRRSVNQQLLQLRGG